MTKNDFWIAACALEQRLFTGKITYTQYRDLKASLKLRAPNDA